MKAKKWLTIITLVITALSLVLAFIIGKNSNCVTYDISMAIFGGREASMVELGNLDNAYGNLDFIIANKCIRQKAYEQIYDKLRKIVYQFRNEVYHFNLLKDGNGNFPVCILKVSELNQKYFLSKEENFQGYTNVSIFQNVFDDIDASLEKFRCKIYKSKYVESKPIPVSGKTVFNNNEK